MSGVSISADALGRLRAAKAAMYEKPGFREIAEARDSVLARYRPAFQPGAVEVLDEEVLRSFLRFENNRHWSGLFRQGNRICADMPTTRTALAELVDETRPIRERTGAATAIKGMGKGIISAILLVAYPDIYGVWNRTSEDRLTALNLMPSWPRGASFGERYAALNQVLVELARLLDVDLWTLDAIWWALQVDDEGLVPVELPVAESRDLPHSPVGRFTLERHLHDYMFDNWGKLDLGREWCIFEREGEPDAGYEFRTPVGVIDLLAKHRHEPRWLVVELKREKSSDRVVGQVLRYMGWIKAHLADATESVEGLVVATEGDAQLHYALSILPGVSFKSYEVEFRLKDGPTFEEFARP